jgi:hypothetical protein
MRLLGVDAEAALRVDEVRAFDVDCAPFFDLQRRTTAFPPAA